MDIQRLGPSPLASHGHGLSLAGRHQTRQRGSLQLNSNVPMSWLNNTETEMPDPGGLPRLTHPPC